MRSVGYKGMLNEDNKSFNNLQNHEERMRDEAESKGGESNEKVGGNFIFYLRFL